MEVGYIYKITNKINNKIYVGQTIDPRRRWYDHKYEGQQEEHRYQSHLYNAMKKYEIDNFSFEIIEECDRDKLDERERFWIFELNTLSPNGYNILPGGKKLFGENNPFYGKTHTEETRKILSEKHKGMYDGEKNPMYGKHHTDETKEKIKQKNIEKGMYEYHSNRMMNNRTWENHIKVNPIVMINHKKKNVLLFYTISSAGRFLKDMGISDAKNPDGIIRRCLKNSNGRKTAYDCEWIYAKELIKGSFSYRGFSSYGFTNFITCNDDDKNDILFKPYFYENKDDVIDFSEYYDEIANRTIEAKNILINLFNGYSNLLMEENAS